MILVATVMTPSAHPALSVSLLSDLARNLKSPRPPAWLHEGVAADIVFDGDTAEALAETKSLLEQRLLTMPVDVVVQPVENRKKKLLIADMDSTMIGQECIDELAGEIGVKEQVSDITERAMHGEIAFEPALRQRVALLAGLPQTIVDKVIDARIRLTPGARTLVRTMARNGAYCALVSGGFTAFTEIIAERIGFHENRANLLEVDKGHFTGTVREPILGRDAKRRRLLDLCVERSIDRADTLAVGDGANDLDMVTEAGLGIAYHAKPALADKADARIRWCDLTALLYAQGYRINAFVDDDS